MRSVLHPFALEDGRGGACYRGDDIRILHSLLPCLAGYAAVLSGKSFGSAMGPVPHAHLGWVFTKEVQSGEVEV